MSFKNRGSLKKIRTNIFKSSNYNYERYRRNDQLEKIVDPINLKKRKKKYIFNPSSFFPRVQRASVFLATAKSNYSLKS